MPKRTLYEWNNRFEHWERPASDTEEAKIERAAAMVLDALDDNAWLDSEGVVVRPQGSYYNNTNVRLDSDMDLRAVHPGMRVEYEPGVDFKVADAALNYTVTGQSLADLNTRLRKEMVSALRLKFGYANVDDSGERAIHVKELPGSRAEIDVVPAFVLRHVFFKEATRTYDTLEGVAIRSKSSDNWTLNFPEYHYGMGVKKRRDTKLRFKKNVRMLKRLRNEMAEEGNNAAARAPSFLIECLVHAVEDDWFLVDEDDRYTRLVRLLFRLQVLFTDPNWVTNVVEINGVKRLFGSWQKWRPEDASAFVNAAVAQLD